MKKNKETKVNNFKLLKYWKLFTLKFVSTENSCLSWTPSKVNSISETTKKKFRNQPQTNKHVLEVTLTASPREAEVLVFGKGKCLLKFKKIYQTNVVKGESSVWHEVLFF